MKKAILMNITAKKSRFN